MLNKVNKQLRKELGLYGFSYSCVIRRLKYFTQIHRNF